VKLTCGDVGKLTRIADSVGASDFYSRHPRKNADAPFLVLGGFADFIVPSAFSAGHGAIVGLGNVAPHAAVRCFTLGAQALEDRAALAEAQRVQGIVARGDFTVAKAGIPGTKWLLEKMHGYGGVCRRPLPPFPVAAQEALWAHPHVQELVALERSLAGKTAKV
jgi:4-hydroxy-2-oxoglutarate aldolase